MRTLFAATLLLSATLLFVVQPMVAKMILPLLGGTPAVWITCMVFFQAVLLLGYLYAHATTRWVPPRWQGWLHVGLLLATLPALALLLLPLRVAHGEPPPSWALMLAAPPTEGNPVGWLLCLLLVTVGLPFFAVSTSAPLLQHWFAGTKDPSANDPYFLYAASNVGSMVALLGYPTLVEPFQDLSRQAWLWGIGFVALVGAVAACAAVGFRGTGPAAAPIESASGKEPVTVSRRLRWLLLAFVPSSLLLGVTSHLSVDIAAIPLLWVVPLALYLLTFILVFARRQWLAPRWLVLALPALILWQFSLTVVQDQAIGVKILVHLLTFFVAAMVCHAELARLRPSTRHLTEYYLLMSAGGVLGGLFNGVLAPLVFSSVLEYPLALALVCLVGPRFGRRGVSRNRLLDTGLPILVGMVTPFLMVFIRPDQSADWSEIALTIAVPLCCYAAVARFSDRPLLFGIGPTSLLVVTLVGTAAGRPMQYQERGFFGVLRVSVNDDRHVVQLYHGSTIHGEQSLYKDRKNEPMTYYSRQGPIGQVFAALGTDYQRPVGIIGLGTGTLAAYGHAGQEMTFYEIDPAIKRLANEVEPLVFTFIADSPADVRIVLGDGRLSLAKAPDDHYGLIVVDAFSSDAIPVHLLTQEALKSTYLPKLREGGILAFHISNRYLELSTVLGSLAADAGMAGLVQEDPGSGDGERYPSTWALLARDRADFGKLTEDRRWKPLTGSAEGVWTDDFSNVFRVFKWRSEGALPAPRKPSR